MQLVLREIVHEKLALQAFYLNLLKIFLLLVDQVFRRESTSASIVLRINR
jgi:hypothetical protein